LRIAQSFECTEQFAPRPVIVGKAAS